MGFGMSKEKKVSVNECCMRGGNSSIHFEDLWNFTPPIFCRVWHNIPGARQISRILGFFRSRKG